MPLNLRDIQIDSGAQNKPQGKFDLDKPRLNLRDVIGDEKKEPKISPGASAVSGLAQGLTLGFGDEIAGAGRAAVDYGMQKLANLTTPQIEGVKNPEPQFLEPYRKYQKEQERYTNQAYEDNPGVYTGAQVAGDVGLQLSPIGAALSPTKGAGIVKNAAKMGTLGSVYGAGRSEGTLDDQDSQNKLFVDSLVGGTIGAGTQGVLQGAGNALGKLSPENLRKFARERAVVATGAPASERKSLVKSGKIWDLGKDLLEKKIVTAAADLSDIAERAGTAKKIAGEKIGAAVKKVDDILYDAVKKIRSGDITSPDLKPSQMVRGLREDYQFNQERIADRIQNELIRPNIKDPNLSGEMAKLQKLAQKYRQNRQVPLEAGQQIKSNKRRTTNFNSETVPQAFNQDVYKIVSEELSNSVGKVSSLLNLVEGKSIPKGSAASLSKDIKDEFIGQNKTYGSMANVENWAKDRLGTEAGQRQLGLTDYLSMIAGLSSGSAGTGVAAALANKAARKYGPSSQAAMANTAANVIDSAPGVLKSVSEELYNAAKTGILPPEIARRIIDVYTRENSDR